MHGVHGVQGVHAIIPCRSSCHFRYVNYLTADCMTCRIDGGRCITPIFELVTDVRESEYALQHSGVRIYPKSTQLGSNWFPRVWKRIKGEASVTSDGNRYKCSFHTVSNRPVTVQKISALELLLYSIIGTEEHDHTLNSRSPRKIEH
jgi:hypothetical protein